MAENDDEVAQDEALDELASYFSGEKSKVVVTTSKNCSKVRSCWIAKKSGLLNLFVMDGEFRCAMNFVPNWCPCSLMLSSPSVDPIMKCGRSSKWLSIVDLRICLSSTKTEKHQVSG